MSPDLQVRLARFGYWLGLMLLATAGAAAIVMGNPRTVKQAVRDSDVYQAAGNLLSDQSGSQLGPAVQPAIESAASKAFDSGQFQRSSETAIDSVYHWLDGSQAEPQFRIDLTPLRDSFISNISTSATTHLKGLPACTPAQLQAMGPQMSDLLSIACLPPGLSPEVAAKQAVDKLQAENELLKQPVLTAESLPKNNRGQNPFQAAASAPQAFQALQLIPWLAAGFCVIMAGLIFLRTPNAYRASYIIARTTLWAGLVILVLAGLSHLVFVILTQADSSVAQSVEGTPQALLLLFVRSLESSLSRLTLQIGAAYLVIGWLTAIALRLLAMRRQHDGAGGQPPAVV